MGIDNNTRKKGLAVLMVVILVIIGMTIRLGSFIFDGEDDNDNQLNDPDDDDGNGRFQNDT